MARDSVVGRRDMRVRGVPFKVAINDAIRAGLASTTLGRQPFRTAAADLGTPTVNLDRALQLAAELEDEEALRRMRLGK
jgi:hypothetical protein